MITAMRVGKIAAMATMAPTTVMMTVVMGIVPAISPANTMSASNVAVASVPQCSSILIAMKLIPLVWWVDLVAGREVVAAETARHAQIGLPHLGLGALLKLAWATF